MSSAHIVGALARPLPLDLAALTGIAERRVRDRRPGTGEDSLALAVRAALDCLASSRHRAEDLDVVISASITRYRGERMQWEPALALEVCREIGAVRALYFDVSNACAGMMTGVSVLDHLIRSGQVRNGLVVSGECATTVAETAQREITGLRDPRLASLTVGDAGAAVVMDLAEPGAPDRVHYAQLMTSARFARLCTARPSDLAPGMTMHTDSAELHGNDVVGQWPALYRNLLDRLGLAFDDERFDFLIPHQVSSGFVERVRQAGERELGPMPPMLTVLDRYGNTASTSLFVTLHDHLRGRAGTGPAKYLVVVSASGVVMGVVSVTVSPAAVRAGLAGATGAAVVV
ncbi:3-oxoacyl-[acyl-carrier-protein] synthase III C-terminal domain-containing protein [Kitasatospora albolonga]|uniref:3-oxoacyl-ACP synthase III family protein n=1 Tax=Kitasatospora albolonga TaxID=68173 RepID=UPI0031E55697